MLPISDENYVRPSVPFINYGLIALNLIAFFYQLSLGGEQAMAAFFDQYALVPAEISRGQELHTLLTSQFLHGGWLHLGSNMLYLWIFGDNIEEVLGHLKYLLFYLGAGVVAALAQVLVDPASTIPSLGASGAVAGVLGAYIVLFPRARVNTLVFIGILFFFTRLNAILVIGFWAVLQFFNGFAEISNRTAQTASQGGVAYWAHIGGFVAGLVIGFVARQLYNPARNRFRAY